MRPLPKAFGVRGCSNSDIRREQAAELQAHARHEIKHSRPPRTNPEYARSRKLSEFGAALALSYRPLICCLVTRYNAEIW
jgi:hypothetical protein